FRISTFTNSTVPCTVGQPRARRLLTLLQAATLPASRITKAMMTRFRISSSDISIAPSPHPFENRSARLYNHSSMPVTVRSFAKINLGLCIGALRADGFHELSTVYQTIALHDVLQVSIGRGRGIEIRCPDPRVPTDDTNTCYRIAVGAMSALKATGRITIE